MWNIKVHNNRCVRIFVGNTFLKLIFIIELNMTIIVWDFSIIFFSFTYACVKKNLEKSKLHIYLQVLFDQQVDNNTLKVIWQYHLELLLYFLRSNIFCVRIEIYQGSITIIFTSILFIVIKVVRNLLNQMKKKARQEHEKINERTNAIWTIKKNAVL